jgi:hypothetical protein
MSRQAADTEFLLSSFSPRLLPEITVWLAGNSVTRPMAQYLLGLLMVFQRAAGGNTVYFLGEVSAAGWWYYFPVVFLMKEPIASLIMIAAAILAGMGSFVKSFFAVIFKRSPVWFEYLAIHFPEFSMIVFVGSYWLLSILSNLNIGVRHIIPALPFIYILTAGVIKKWFSLEEISLIRNFVVQILVLAKKLIGISVKTGVLIGLLLWYLISSFISYPYFIAYFNAVFGGSGAGYRYATDSNYDWGQDLKRLKKWVGENLTENEKIAVDYFGGGNIKYYLGDRAELWWSARGNPALENIKWLAVSINTIQGAKGRLAPGQPRKPEDEYQWLDKLYEPYAIAGKSIFIYQLH